MHGRIARRHHWTPTRGLEDRQPQMPQGREHRNPWGWWMGNRQLLIRMDMRPGRASGVLKIQKYACPPTHVYKDVLNFIPESQHWVPPKHAPGEGTNELRQHLKPGGQRWAGGGRHANSRSPGVAVLSHVSSAPSQGTPQGPPGQ